METTRDMKRCRLELTRKSYIEKVLKVFQMDTLKAVKTPMWIHFKLKVATAERLEMEVEEMRAMSYANVVGSILYMMIGTRPGIAYSVGVVSRYMGNHVKEHWLAVKWILKYLKGTSYSRLVFQKNGELKLTGFCDSDYASGLDMRRSITSFVFTLGGTAISWKSGLQKVVAFSTTEAEYIVLTEAAKEAIWLRGLVGEFGYTQEQVEIFCDSERAIALSKNNVHHEWTKHVAVKFHFIREKIEEGSVKVSKISTP